MMISGMHGYLSTFKGDCTYPLKKSKFSHFKTMLNSTLNALGMIAEPVCTRQALQTNIVNV